MTTLTDLTNAIDSLLNLSSVGKVLNLNSNTCERAYEAYVFCLCIKAVVRANGQYALMGINSGPALPSMVFRGAPGSMASRSQDFCYARCSLGTKEFEIHVDVEYEGQSNATHEIDVSLCAADHCDKVRNTGRLPRTRKNLLMLFECKYYSNPPGVSLARTFVGLRIDCTGYQLGGFISNQTSQNLRNYLSRKNGPKPFLLDPRDPQSEERFVGTLEEELRQWARV